MILEQCGWRSSVPERSGRPSRQSCASSVTMCRRHARPAGRRGLLRGGGGASRAPRQRDARERLARGARCGGHGECRGQGADRRLERTRLQPGRPPMVGACRSTTASPSRSSAPIRTRRSSRRSIPANTEVMVDPRSSRRSRLFVCGNDDGAKAQVVELLTRSAATRADPRPRRHHECARHRAVRRACGSG